MESTRIAMILVAAAFGFCIVCNGLPVVEPNDSSSSSSEEEIQAPQTLILSNTSVNGSKNLYVIKAVVYEIGILTDTSDEDNSTSEERTQERVDLTFFDTHSNKTHIDLGNVPLPVQTNISGQVLTGIAPFNIGAFSNPADLLSTLPITGTVVNITHSSTAFFQLTSRNVSDTDTSHLLKPDDLSKISELTNAIPGISNGTKTVVSPLKEPKNPNVL